MPRPKGGIKMGRVHRKKRSPSEFARVYGSRARVEWIKAQACVGCGKVGKSDNAHVCGNGGMSRKGNFDEIAPLCRPCHRAFDQHLWPWDAEHARAFMRQRAAHTERQWLEYNNSQRGTT
jgi:hypothetical protein